MPTDPQALVALKPCPIDGDLIALFRREGRHSGVWFAEHLLRAADLLEASGVLAAPTDALQWIKDAACGKEEL
jgi:hypothetical protein